MKVRLKNESINSFLNRMHLSKKKIYDLRINKKIDGNYKDFDEVLNDEIIINLDEESNYKEEDGILNIIYEDENYLVINKPRGIIIHDEANSLANLVSAYFKKNNIKAEVRYPSRLDRNTTGVVIFPKNMLIASYLDFLFANDVVKKEYIALCHNEFKNDNGTINYNIGTDRHNNNRMVTTINGKPAITNYKVLKNGKVSYVSINIKTGRTHQIRVHFAKIGHPILGDDIYGLNDGELMLHCKKIEFINYDGKKICFIADEDKKFRDKMKEISVF